MEKGKKGFTRGTRILSHLHVPQMASKAFSGDVGGYPMSVRTFRNRATISPRVMGRGNDLRFSDHVGRQQVVMLRPALSQLGAYTSIHGRKRQMSSLPDPTRCTTA